MAQTLQPPSFRTSDLQSDPATAQWRRTRSADWDRLRYTSKCKRQSDCSTLCSTPRSSLGEDWGECACEDVVAQSRDPFADVQRRRTSKSVYVYSSSEWHARLGSVGGEECRVGGSGGNNKNGAKPKGVSRHIASLASQLFMYFKPMQSERQEAAEAIDSVRTTMSEYWDRSKLRSNSRSNVRRIPRENSFGSDDEAVNMVEEDRRQTRSLHFPHYPSVACLAERQGVLVEAVPLSQSMLYTVPTGAPFNSAPTNSEVTQSEPASLIKQSSLFSSANSEVTQRVPEARLIKQSSLFSPTS